MGVYNYFAPPDNSLIQSRLCKVLKKLQMNVKIEGLCIMASSDGIYRKQVTFNWKVSPGMWHPFVK
jgi:hypothetical protein